MDFETELKKLEDLLENQLIFEDEYQGINKKKKKKRGILFIIEIF